MKTKQSTIILMVFSIIISLASCKSAKEKEQDAIKEKASHIFTKAIASTWETNDKRTTDSIIKVYNKIEADNVELALAYALQLKKERDSIKQSINDNEQKASVAKADSIETQWKQSKASKINKKHPEWTKDDCIRLSKDQVWIGMHIDMVKYLRGNPDIVNPSNYGKGVRYQYYWRGLNPSSFYSGEDGIVTAYN